MYLNYLICKKKKKLKLPEMDEYTEHLQCLGILIYNFRKLWKIATKNIQNLIEMKHSKNVTVVTQPLFII